MSHISVKMSRRPAKITTLIQAIQDHGGIIDEVDPYLISILILQDY
ncbi:MAG: hypothetical protein EZS28_021261, partial [Streblomastix strix]